MARKKQLHYDNSCLTPIFQNVAFFYENTENFLQARDGQIVAGRYGRYDNPLWLEVEEKLADLESYETALVFASGMNAISSTLLAHLQAGDKVIYTQHCYRNVRVLFNDVLPKFGIRSVGLDQADPHFLANLADACDEQTHVVFLEAPSNPHLYQVDIAEVRQRIGSEVLLIVDSTIATPVNMQPKQFGADLVIHSCTKYIGGHGDIVAGSVAGDADLIGPIRNIRNIMGGILQAQSAHLLNRSLDTLTLRIQHFNQEGLRLAQYLEDHPQIKRVFYTGLPSHPHYQLAQKYLRGHGGLVTFELDADAEQTAQFVDALKLPFMGSNFGSTTTMVEQCAPFSYHRYTQAERNDLNISNSLIRLGLAYEPVDGLIDDINQALEQI